MHNELRVTRLEPYPPLVPNKRRDVTAQLLLSDADRAEIMDTVRHKLYAHGDLRELAQAIGRSERCLYAIRGGYTRWPRWETLFALLPHLGLRLVVVPAGKGH